MLERVLADDHGICRGQPRPGRSRSHVRLRSIRRTRPHSDCTQANGRCVLDPTFELVTPLRSSPTTYMLESRPWPRSGKLVFLLHPARGPSKLFIWAFCASLEVAVFNTPSGRPLLPARGIPKACWPLGHRYSGAKVERTFRAGIRKRLFDTVGIEFGSVDRGTGLLAPRVV